MITTQKDSMTTRFKQLLSLAKKEWVMLTIGTLMLFIGIAMTLIYPQLFKVIIDEALLDKEPITLNQSTVLLVGSFVIYALSGGLRYWLFTYSGEKVVAALRCELFSHLLHQDIAFFDKQQTGKLLSRLSADTEAIQHTLSQEIGLLMRYFFTAIGGIVLLMITSIELTLLLLLVVPIAAYSTGISGNYIRKYSSETQSALAQASGHAEESLSSVRVVRSYAREHHELASYATAIANGLAFVKSRVALVATLEGFVNLMASLAVVAVLWYGSTLVISNEISVGSLTSFLIYTFLVTSSLTGLANIWTDFTRAAGAADRVFSLLNNNSKTNAIQTVFFSNLQGAISFRNVEFSYPSRPDLSVLNSFSFNIKAGECVAIVGPSGGGKSTLAALLSRFYDVNSGEILLDGLDIKQFDSSTLRSQIALVEQEPILFSTSIYENVRYGRLNATHEEIQDAIAMANAADFINDLPLGLDTHVGAKGVQLSGGQKQRLAIARAILKNPKILILDEVTSALDADNEKLIADAIHKFKFNKTTLIIAHRPSTVQLADRVIQLSNKSINEISLAEYSEKVMPKSMKSAVS